MTTTKRSVKGSALTWAEMDANMTEVDAAGLAQDFKLSVVSGDPVPGDTAIATTVYATPKTGSRIALHNGVQFVNYTSAEFSIALGTLTANIGYDLFVYPNAGVPTLELLAWASSSARTTDVVRDAATGILTKSGDLTRRWLGSFYTISTTQTSDTGAHTGITTGRYLYNYYHRVDREMWRQDSTTSWTYNTAAWRQARASNTNQLNFFIGLVEDGISASLTGHGSQASASYEVGVGISRAAGATASIVPISTAAVVTPVNGYYSSVACDLDYVPVLGLNNIAWLETGNVTSIATYYGISGNIRSTLSGKVRL